MKDLSGVSSLISSMSNSSSSNSSSFYNINLSEYKMIKSGSYHKLMKTYYAQDSNSSDSDSSSSVNKLVSQLTNKTDTTGLTKLNSTADTLEKTASDLASSKKWDDADANKDDLVSSVQTFVSDYNKVVEQTGNVTSSDVKNSVSWMTSLTTAMKDSLSKVGVSVGTDNQLSVNEDTLKNASTKDLKNLFSGISSYGGQIGTKASAIKSSIASQGIYASDGSITSGLSGMYSSSV